MIPGGLRVTRPRLPGRFFRRADYFFRLLPTLKAGATTRPSP